LFASMNKLASTSMLNFGKLLDGDEQEVGS
jgi:hypothetical protein